MSADSRSSSSSPSSPYRIRPSVSQRHIQSRLPEFSLFFQSAQSQQDPPMRISNRSNSRSSANRPVLSSNHQPLHTGIDIHNDPKISNNNNNINNNDNTPLEHFIPDYLKETAYYESYRATLNLKSTSKSQYASLDPGLIPPPTPKDDSSQSVRPLPSHMVNKDSLSKLNLFDHRLEMRFIGPQGKNSEEAAAARSDVPIPRQCGVFYYEVEIVSRGAEGYIGIGVSGPKAALNRLPGWEIESWGYHGDDGNAFCAHGNGKPYGPSFTTGDVIGCAVNFYNGTIFYTKNGFYLDVAFRDVKATTLYPSVGLRSLGEHVRINFGSQPFRFDIANYVRGEKHKMYIEQGIIDSGGSKLAAAAAAADGDQNGTSTPIDGSSSTSINKRLLSDSSSPDHLNSDERDIAWSLVGQYLTHYGYAKSAKAFSELVSEERALIGDNKSPDNHNGVQGSTLASAEESQDMENRQLIRNCIVTQGDIDRALELTNDLYPAVFETNKEILFKLECAKFIEMVGKMSEGPGDVEMTMEEDDEDGGGGGQQRERKASTGDTESLLLQAVEYGQGLQQQYGSMEIAGSNEALDEAFALLAYTDPRGSKMADLLSPERRINLAQELNSAILAGTGRSATAYLEMLSLHTCSLVDWLATRGGPASIMNVTRDFISRPE